MKTINVTSGLRAALAAVVLLATGSAFNQAKAQVAVDVDISLNGIVILYYYDTIEVNLDVAALFDLTGCTGSLTDGSACEHGLLSGTSLTLPGNVPVTPAPSATLGAAPLTITNAWAVRAIASSTEQVRVSITAGTEDLENGTASIEITGATVTSGAAGPGASIEFAPPGLVNPRFGDVTLTLDFTNATFSGNYSSATGEDYTLDVELM